MRCESPRGTALASVAVFALLALAAAAGAEEADKPMIVKIHADWCGTCTRLDTTFEQLEERVGSDARIVVLDVTDRDAVDRSTAEADRLGIRPFFDRYKSKTGTVGVFDAGGGEIIVLKGELDPEPYVAAVKKAGEA
jgi:thiol-disulfide isomerase/thioredoxin